MEKWCLVLVRQCASGCWAGSFHCDPPPPPRPGQNSLEPPHKTPATVLAAAKAQFIGVVIECDDLGGLEALLSAFCLVFLCEQ